MKKYYYFKVETLRGNYIVKREDLKEIKKEYDKVLDSYDYLSMTEIRLVNLGGVK